MQEEDAHDDNLHDDNLIAMKRSNQIHIRTQMRAAENAANSHILETADFNDDTNSPLHMRNNPAVPATNENTTTPHFCHPFCRRAPSLVMIQPPRALPLNKTKHQSTRKPC